MFSSLLKIRDKNELRDISLSFNSSKYVSKQSDNYLQMPEQGL